MTVHPGTLMSIDSFLDWCAGQEGRYELSGGVLTPMMMPATSPHTKIALRLGIQLDAQLTNLGYDVGIGMRGVIAGSSYRIPDVLVERPAKGKRSDTASQPVLIFEVLSESTKGVDFGPKVREYLNLPTLTAYVILSQDKPEAWVWERIEGRWPNSPTYLQSGGAIAIHDPPFSLSLDTLFTGIPLSDADEP